MDLSDDEIIENEMLTDRARTYVDCAVALETLGKVAQTFRECCAVLEQLGTVVEIFELECLYRGSSPERIYEKTEQTTKAFARAAVLYWDGVQPAVAYRQGGSCFGRNLRGKKRWLLKLKQARSAP